MVELTDEEKEVLAELNEKGIVVSKTRYAEGQTEDDRKRNHYFKLLVYKDLINISVDKAGNYVFLRRSSPTGRF